MTNYRVTRNDLAIRSEALTEVLSNISLNDFDLIAEAREGLQRMGDIPRKSVPLVESTKALRASIASFRKNLDLEEGFKSGKPLEIEDMTNRLKRRKRRP